LAQIATPALHCCGACFPRFINGPIPAIRTPKVTLKPHLTPTEPAKRGPFDIGQSAVERQEQGDRFMTYFTPARAIAALATTSVAALMVSSALAQTPPAQPKPATPARPAASTPAKPAQPAPAQPAPQAQPAQPAQPGQQGAAANPPVPQLIYSQWVKFCVGPDGQPADQKDPAIKTKQVCLTGIDGRLESGQPVVAVVAIEPPAEGKKILRVTLPIGMQLQHGTRFIVDEAQPLTAPYVTCFANGCISDYELSADTLGKVKKGKAAVVQGINYNGSAISVPVPLTEFAKAFDGAPTDPKVLEERQKKLEDELKKKGEELQKKANEARQKLEQSGGTPAKPQ
jgi:invasion protein IalB